MEQALIDAPYWVWMVLSALLGGLSIWAYWRMLVWRERIRAESIIAEREAQLAETRAALARTRRDAAHARPAAAPTGARLAADQLSALKYRAWLAERRAARGLPAPTQPTALATPQDPARERRLEDRLERAIAAAKLGAMGDFAAIEREMTDDPAPDRAFDAEPAEAMDGVDLVGDGAESSLRYRNWLLATRLDRVLASVRSGLPVDADAALSELRAGARWRRAPAVETEPPLALASPIDDDAASEEIARLKNENATLRYRRHALSRAVGEVARAARADRAIDADALAAATQEVGEAVEIDPSAPFAPYVRDAAVAAGGDEALRLRRRLETVTAEVRRLRATPADVSALEEVRAAAGSLRHRLWLAQREITRLRAAPPTRPGQPAVETPPTEPIRFDPAPLVAQTGVIDRAQRWVAARTTDRLRQIETRLTESETVRARTQSRLDEEAEAAAQLRAQLWRFERDGQSAAERVGALEARLEVAERSLAEARAAVEAGEERRVGAEARISELTGQIVELTRERDAARRSATPSPIAAAEPNLRPARRIAADPGGRRLVAPLLAEAQAAPLGGSEREALELIEEGGLVATGENRPEALLSRPRDGAAPDDLKLIASIDARREAALNGAGLYYFDQLAGLRGRELAWLDDRLAARGAVVEERWAAQAARLAELRAANRLAIGPEGSFTATEDTLRRAPERLAEAAKPKPAAPTPSQAADFTAPPRRPGRADNLQLIERVGPKLEARLNALRIDQFCQIARLNPEGLEALDAALGLGGRVAREDWGAQARAWDARKSGGGMLVGGERKWTAPTDAEAYEAAIAGAMAEPLSAAEAEARRLLSLGVKPKPAARPSALLAGPSGVSPDALSLIRGVGAAYAPALNELGLYYYRQLAEMSGADLAWIDTRLGAGGRVAEDRWAAQAAALDRRGF